MRYIRSNKSERKYNEFTREILKTMLDKDMTIDELAQGVGYSSDYVGRCIRCESPSVILVHKIVEFLDVDRKYLLLYLKECVDLKQDSGKAGEFFYKDKSVSRKEL